MNKPLISILIPSFNEGETILKVLNRILETSGANSFYEIIIIDDGSTDNTKDLLEKNKNLYTNLITYNSNRGKGYAIKRIRKSNR